MENEVKGAVVKTDEPGAQGKAEKIEQHEKMFSQADVDKIISDRLERENKKWQRTVEEKLTEAKKMAKMNADEKAEYERKQAEDDYQRRLTDVTIRELKAEARETLASRGLPTELSGVLNYTDADTCKTSIDALEKAFKSAVADGVEQRLKSSSTTPHRDEKSGSLSGLEAAFYSINPKLKK